METEDISFIMRCLGVVVVCLGIVGAVFTYDLLLELPFFTNLLFELGWR